MWLTYNFQKSNPDAKIILAAALPHSSVLNLLVPFIICYIPFCSLIAAASMNCQTSSGSNGTYAIPVSLFRQKF